MRKSFTILFISLLVVSLANAAIVEGSCGSNLTWSLNTKDSTITIEGTGSMEDYPEYLAYAPWYDYRSYIANISFPEGITYIGERAFYTCNNLRFVSIPGSVKRIGAQAFRATPLEHVIFGNISFVIDSRAFQSCRSLVNLENLEYATSIGNYAFDGCSKLSFVNIAATKGIGEYAFQNCTQLMGLIFPDSLVKIGSYAFYNCTSLTHANLPNSVKTIGDWAFGHCTSIVSATLPDSLGTVPDNMFNGCNNLLNIKIPKGTSIIGNSSFAGCSKLNDVDLGDFIIYIWSRAFSYCKSLKNIEIPETTFSIASNAFERCDSLETVVWNSKHGADTSPIYPLFGGDKSKVSSFTFGPNVEYIPAALCYKMRKLTSIDIPDSVTAIGEFAFTECNTLETVTIGNGITSLGRSSFPNCVTSLSISATTPPAGGLNCGINPANCTLYVPEESVEVYSNTLWWEDFFAILPIQNTGTDIDNTFVDNAKVTKAFSNGQIYIMRDKQTFTITGTKVN